jgi:hypothetical protein
VPLSRDLKMIHLYACYDVHSVIVAIALGAETTRVIFVRHYPVLSYANWLVHGISRS